MQVLSLTPEQINNLAEPERAAINQLVCPCWFPFFFHVIDGAPSFRRGASLWVLLVVALDKSFKLKEHLHIFLFKKQLIQNFIILFFLQRKKKS